MLRAWASHGRKDTTAKTEKKSEAKKWYTIK